MLRQSTSCTYNITILFVTLYLMNRLVKTSKNLTKTKLKLLYNIYFDFIKKLEN